MKCGNLYTSTCNCCRGGGNAHVDHVACSLGLELPPCMLWFLRPGSQLCSAPWEMGFQSKHPRIVNSALCVNPLHFDSHDCIVSTDASHLPSFRCARGLVHKMSSHDSSADSTSSREAPQWPRDVNGAAVQHAASASSARNSLRRSDLPGLPLLSKDQNLKGLLSATNLVFQEEPEVSGLCKAPGGARCSPQLAMRHLGKPGILPCVGSDCPGMRGGYAV